ncbi:MAG: hypothetical protein K2V38_04790, partial [Gemmataceae bacterium]|nr:hypothetical protein [Gemmataceae bacterium]
MQVIELPGPPTEVQSVSFAPDGRLLAVRGYGHVFLLDTLTGAAQRFWAAASAYALSGTVAGFTADGGGIVLWHTWGEQNEVTVHALDTAAPLRELSLAGRGECECALGPGGRFVYVLAGAFSSGLTFLHRWNPLSGEEAPVLGRVQNGARRFAVSADEHWLAVAGGGMVWVWSL